MITDRIGQHGVLLPLLLIISITKFEKEKGEKLCRKRKDNSLTVRYAEKELIQVCYDSTRLLRPFYLQA